MMANRRPAKRPKKKDEPAPPATTRRKDQTLDFPVELPSRRWLAMADNGKSQPPRVAAPGT